MENESCHLYHIYITRALILLFKNYFEENKYLHAVHCRVFLLPPGPLWPRDYPSLALCMTFMTWILPLCNHIYKLSNEKLLNGEY